MRKIKKWLSERFTSDNFNLFMLDLMFGAFIAFLLMFCGETVITSSGELYIHKPAAIVTWYILWRAWVNFTKK